MAKRTSASSSVAGTDPTTTHTTNNATSTKSNTTKSNTSKNTNTHPNITTTTGNNCSRRNTITAPKPTRQTRSKTASRCKSKATSSSESLKRKPSPDPPTLDHSPPTQPTKRRRTSHQSPPSSSLDSPPSDAPSADTPSSAASNSLNPSHHPQSPHPSTSRNQSMAPSGRDPALSPSSRKSAHKKQHQQTHPQHQQIPSSPHSQTPSTLPQTPTGSWKSKHRSRSDDPSDPPHPFRPSGYDEKSSGVDEVMSDVGDPSSTYPDPDEDFDDMNLDHGYDDDSDHDLDHLVDEHHEHGDDEDEHRGLGLATRDDDHFYGHGEEAEGEAGGEEEEEEDDEEDDEDEEEDEDEDGDASMHHPFRGFGNPVGLSGALRVLSDMMSGVSSKFQRLLSSLRQPDDLVRQAALQQLSEELLFSNEETLASQVPIEAFVQELVKLVQREDHPEIMLLACRCLTNMMETLPSTVSSVVLGGAIPVLCGKLLEISFIDVAEQALDTLHKISQDYPDAIVRHGGLSACLSYLDFFPTSVQRTAVTTAANCCHSIPLSSYDVVADVLPKLRDILQSSDQSVVDQAALCISRIVDSFRYHSAELEKLITPDLLHAVVHLVSPNAGRVSGYTYTLVIRVLAHVARASPQLTLALLKLNIADTLFQILTGLYPPTSRDPKPDSLVIMQALLQRPRDQIVETLNVICEILPAIPTSAGLLSFPSLGPQATTVDPTASLPESPVVPSASASASASVSASVSASKSKRDGKSKTEGKSKSNGKFDGKSDKTDKSDKSTDKSGNARRVALFDQHPQEVGHFATVLFPILMDTVTSTLNLQVRHKALLAQVKLLSNLKDRVLTKVLAPVPYPAFLAALLTQRDDPPSLALAVAAATVLLNRLPDIYYYPYYREGVMTEMETLNRQYRERANKPDTGKSSIVSSSTSDEDEDEDEDVDVDVDVDMGERLEGFEEGEDHDGDALMGEAASFGRQTQDHGWETEEESDDAACHPPSSSTRTSNIGDDLRDDDNHDDSEDEDGESDGESASRKQAASLLYQFSRHVPVDEHALVVRMTDTFLENFTQGERASRCRGPRQQAEAKLASLKTLAHEIQTFFQTTTSTTNPVALAKAHQLFRDLATRFSANALDTITSTEFVSSGLVRVLVDVLRSSKSSSSSSTQLAQKAFLTTFMTTFVTTDTTTFVTTDTTTFVTTDTTNVDVKDVRTNDESGLQGNQSGHDESGHRVSLFSVFVSKLHEVLSRSEHFDILTVGSAGGSSSPRGSLARQIRLRLTADEASHFPSSYANMIVSIHAIATFQSLDDYLRPRITLSEEPKDASSRADGLSLALAALTGGNLDRSSFAGRLAHGSRRSPDTETDKTDKSDRSGEKDNNTKDESQDPSSERETSDSKETHDSKETPDSKDTPMSEGPSRAEQDPSDAEATQTDKKDKPSNAGPSSDKSSDKSSQDSQDSQDDKEWHLEFAVHGKPVSNDTTIYRAIAELLAERGQTFDRNTWLTPHAVTFRRVRGTISSDRPLTRERPRTETKEGGEEEKEEEEDMTTPSSFADHPDTASILQLLRILHDVHANAEDILGVVTGTSLPLDESVSQFVNTKLTAKLNRQLEEPLVAASNYLPPWIRDLVRCFPFVLSFDTRLLFLQSTALGYGRSISRWQEAQASEESHGQNQSQSQSQYGGGGGGGHGRDHSFLRRLPRQKVRIGRPKMFESALKVMDRYGSSESILEMEYFDEAGVGLGPTLEFFATVSQEFASTKLDLWRTDSHTATATATADPGRGSVNEGHDSQYVFSPTGLFPRPMSDEEVASAKGQQILFLFTMLGKFVARSMADSRRIDIHFNPTFFRIALERPGEVKPSLGAVKAIDPALAQSLVLLQKFVDAKQARQAELAELAGQADQGDGAVAGAGSAGSTGSTDIIVDGCRVEDLCLDFTLPGYSSIEFGPGGRDKAVTTANVDEYLQLVMDMTLEGGVRHQIDAFKSGFSQVFSFGALGAFTPAELVTMFGRREEDWSMETLSEAILAKHGFHRESESVQHLLQFMASLTEAERRAFLRFLTGSPVLPIGGFRALSPPLTVVCKTVEEPLTPDGVLPSVMTCAHFLKMPRYSSYAVLRARFTTAMHEGQGAFLLS